MIKKEKKNFNNIVKNKKIPILTLDVRWHELFPDDSKTARIKELELEVNNLLKQQGKMVNDIKDMKKLKKSLIKDIVVNMDIGTDLIGKEKEKKLDKNKQYITEINDKIDQSMDDLSKIPYEIKAVNDELMVESMKVCYDQMQENKKELAQINEWIAGIREELKMKILSKQDMEIKNKLVYTYMHDILGADLMEAFDESFEFKPEDKKS